MKTDQILKVLKNERECVRRQSWSNSNVMLDGLMANCDKNCAKCDLCLSDTEILEVYDFLINGYEMLQNKGAGMKKGDLISRSYLKQMIPAPIEDEYKYVHQIIDNAPPVDAYPFEQLQELVKLNQQFAQKIENLEKPQPEWVTDELCRLRSCLRSGTHVGSFLQTQAQMDRFIRALDEVIKPN